MTQIGRDHGKLKHEVEELPMSEIAWYAANYRHDAEESEKRRAAAEAKAKAESKKK